MDCYIVRVYRRNGEKHRLLVGTVEEVGVLGKKRFSDFEELKGILALPYREDPRGGGKGNRPRGRS